MKVQLPTMRDSRDPELATRRRELLQARIDEVGRLIAADPHGPVFHAVMMGRWLEAADLSAELEQGCRAFRRRHLGQLADALGAVLATIDGRIAVAIGKILEADAADEGPVASEVPEP